MLLTGEEVKQNIINKGISEEIAKKLVSAREYLLKTWDAATENLEVLKGILPENDPMLLKKKQVVKELYRTQKYHLVYETKITNDKEAIHALNEMNDYIREWLKVFKLPR